MEELAGPPRWRGRNIRMLRPILESEHHQRRGHHHHLLDGGRQPGLQNSMGTVLSNEIVSSNRLTLLPEPDNDDETISSNNIVSSRALAPSSSNRETILPITPPSRSSQDIGLNRMNDVHFIQNQSKTNSLSPPEQQEHSHDHGQQQTSMSSTTALLILLVCYIIWQCFRGQNNRQRKCLDDWPTLLTPSRSRPTRGKRPSGDECELQTIGQVVATTTTTTTTGPTCTNATNDRSNNNSAILRVKCDNPDEVEIIQMDGDQSNCDGTTSGLKGNKTNGIRRSLMRTSLVVAANRAAKPRVKLIGEKVRRFVDIEAQSDDGQTKMTLAGRLVRLLKTSGLLRRNSEEVSLGKTNDEMIGAVGSNVGETRQAASTNEHKGLQTDCLDTPDTAEVVVHRSVIENSSSSESLLGFAGSFLEPVMNQAAENGFGGPDGLRIQQAASFSHNKEHSPNHVIACASADARQQISPMSRPINRNQLDSQADLLLGPCDCVLARSKSQTSQPSYCHTSQAMNQLLTTSPANIRPCCSVSPSAMSRHDNVAQLVHRHHQPEPGGLCGGGQVPPMGPSGHCAIYCGNSRAKHHYENYYDDEQEDAYRRLTASIGVQFGLAMNHHHQQDPLMADTTATCSMACKCNSSPPGQNMIMDHGAMRANLSLGDSDSGNFSLVNKQRVNSDSICNDSNCSLCQSSLLTTAPSQQTINVFANHQASLDPIANVQAPLVSRWHSRRRSALYARQPRRMSIAGMACQPVVANGHGANPQHFLHRASIASDGANGFHQHHHHHYPAARQNYPAASHFCANKKSNYSSSAGSSSGIGFSGSQCLNTPTTGAFPYQSFAITTKPFNDLVAGDRLIQANPPPPMMTSEQLQPTWNVATANFQPHTECFHRLSSSSTSRKFSLPVHLESKAAGQLMTPNYKNDLLFNQQQRDDASSKHSPPTGYRPMPPSNLEQMTEVSNSKISSLNQTSCEQNRRSSQTITRQSSFWLEDGHLEPTFPKQTTLDSTSNPSEQPEQLPQATPRESENMVIDQGIFQRIASPASSSDSPQSPNEDRQPNEFGAGSSATTKTVHPKMQHSSSSSTPSPSPDFHRRQRQRLSNRTSQSSNITKRRFLRSLKQRRGHHHSSNSSHRRHESQTTTTTTNQMIPIEKQHTNSTDDERDKTKQDDSLSSFDREVAGAVSGRTLPDINSTSLERQCRELWKLRATLHDDALVGDNWSNYHQRLNRRYDSGYKSIENQFSSSIEGNVSNVLSLSLHQVSITAGNENDTHELGRPQSGCSGMIQEQAEDPSRNVVSSILNEEETQALLDNCDDQQDEQ